MKSKSSELHNIFKGIANKDENEFNKLYKNYKSLVYSVVFSMLKNEEDSEEVVQTVFEKIWKMKTSNLPTDKEKTWLYNVTKNETINYIRRQKKVLNIDDVYYIDVQNEELNDIIDKEYYNKILSKLNTSEKEIVSLKILASLSFKEISQILNIPIGTVQWKYYKSLDTLKILITNLTMFVLTFTIYIKQKASIKKLENNNEEAMKEKHLQNEAEDATNNNQLEDTEEHYKENEESTSNQLQILDEVDRAQIANKKEEVEKNATQKNQSDGEENFTIDNKNSTTESNNAIIGNKTTEYDKAITTNNTTLELQNITIENAVVNEQQSTNNNNALLYISIIFLIVTIVFSAIWVKQNRQRSKHQ